MELHRSCGKPTVEDTNGSIQISDVCLRSKDILYIVPINFKFLKQPSTGRMKDWPPGYCTVMEGSPRLPSPRTSFNTCTIESYFGLPTMTRLDGVR